MRSPNQTANKQHCMVVHAHYPLGETRVERQAQALRNNGYNVDIICLRSEEELAFESINGVNVYRLPVKRYKKNGLLVQLLEYLLFFTLSFLKLITLHRRQRYQVVQIHNLPDFLVFSALIPKLSGAKLILDLHDLMPEFYAARFNGSMESWPVRLLRLQERLSCGFADYVVTVTELWRKTLIERGVSADKVSVVMNVADDQIFNQDVSPKTLAAGNGNLNIIYHGNLTQRYGIDLLLEALAKVQEQAPHIHLLIHGDGDYKEELMELAKRLNLNSQVTFSTKFVPTLELPQIIKQADVGVAPYRLDVFTDGILPTKLMEYAALKMPVIAARTSAIADYFDDSMVQFFTPGDVDDLARSILTLYIEPERLAQLGKNIDSFNQEHNWRKLGAEYVALVERMGVR